MRKTALAVMVVAGTAVAGAALAWGPTGHRFVAEEALRALPGYMPAFLRSSQAIADVGEYANEPDRWRGAGKVHSERDAQHFIDLNDDGTTLGGMALDQLPETKELYAQAVVAKGGDPDHAGYLPYAEVDAYQQVVKDFAYWRILTLLETREHDKAKLAWYRADRVRREQIIKYDLGLLAHYVGDGTQPLHLSIHYNGWGDFPNPDGYTTDKIHVPLEGPYVVANVSAADVRANMPAYTPCTDPVMTCFTVRLKASFDQVIPMYQLYKGGGFNTGDARGKTFIAKQVGLGAANMRDAVLDAWRDSKTMGVGYPSTTYDDFLANKPQDAFTVLHGDG